MLCCKEGGKTVSSVAVGIGDRPRLLRRLSYSKYLLGVARESLSLPSQLAAAVGLLQMHDSIEIFQVVVLDWIGVSPSSDRSSFMAFWSLVKDKTGSEPPYKSIFKGLNEIRVQFKHHAILPNLQELRTLCAVVPSFYLEVCANVLNLDFTRISLADLLENDEVRSHMKKAEAAIASEEYKNALAESAIAFTALIQEKDTQPAQYVTHGLELFHRMSLSVSPKWERLPVDVSREVDKLCKAFEAQINQVKIVVEMLAWGVDLQKYRKFRYLTPHVARALSGEVELLFERTHAILVNADSANFCFQFVLDTGLRIQEQALRILDPAVFHTLKTSQNPTHLYQIGPDNSLRIAAEIPKGCAVKGRACVAPSLGDAWEVTYNGTDGLIGFSDATLVKQNDE
jgi:hypothetical protein